MVYQRNSTSFWAREEQMSPFNPTPTNRVRITITGRAITSNSPRLELETYFRIGNFAQVFKLIEQTWNGTSLVMVCERVEVPEGDNQFTTMRYPDSRPRVSETFDDQPQVITEIHEIHTLLIPEGNRISIRDMNTPNYYNCVHLYGGMVEGERIEARAVDNNEIRDNGLQEYIEYHREITDVNRLLELAENMLNVHRITPMGEWHINPPQISLGGIELRPERLTIDAILHQGYTYRLRNVWFRDQESVDAFLDGLRNGQPELPLRIEQDGNIVVETEVYIERVSGVEQVNEVFLVASLVLRQIAPIPQFAEGGVVNRPLGVAMIQTGEPVLTEAQIEGMQMNGAMLFPRGHGKASIPIIPPKQEFVVSPLITLKLEWAGYSKDNMETNIYVKGKKFRQCKYLLLDLPTTDEKIEDIDNIDDAAKNYSREMEGGSSKYSIPPETEFWGHCSNLQVWVENDYDLRILHSNLSLPLLKELANHDPRAKMRLKEQLAEKVETGGFGAWRTHYQTLLNHFTIEELLDLKEFVKFPEYHSESTDEMIQELFEEESR